jgi:hypothetical protein
LEADPVAKTPRRTRPKAPTAASGGRRPPTKKAGAAETVGERLTRLTAAWAGAFEALVSRRVAFQALCDEVSAAHAAGGARVAALEARRNRAEVQWRAAERTESQAAAAVLGIWTGGAGDADVLRDESEVEVDPVAALAFWKRVDWESYCGWVGRRFAPPRARPGQAGAGSG